MKNLYLIFTLLLGTFALSAQEEQDTEYAHNTFDGTRVVVGHSVKLLQEGEMEFLIAHKFGRINGGAYEFFGLDQAIIRLGLDYAIKDWLTIGVGRSSLDKQADALLKIRFLRQKKGASNFPVSISGLATTGLILLKANNPLEPILWRHRLSFNYQLLVARQFGERFSVQVMPMVTHYNLIDSKTFSNDVVSIGAAGKYQISKAVAFKAEYYYSLPNQLADNRTNSLAIGFDLDTGSHVFQLHFSNSGGLVEPAFVGNTTGQWLKGDIHFGFTISRVFKLKGRRY